MKLESNKSVVLLLSKLNELWKDVDHPWKKILISNQEKRKLIFFKNVFQK